MQRIMKMLNYFHKLFFHLQRQRNNKEKAQNMWKSHYVILFYFNLIFRLHIFSLLVSIELSKEAWAH
jgi:hypothetical protein